MPSNTAHYNLKKPAYGEAADVAVLNSNMDAIDSAMYDLDSDITSNKPLKCTKTGVNALPTTITKSGITATMQCVKLIVSNPVAQGSDWTIATAAGTVTISGTINATTDLEVWLQEVRS